MAALINGVYDEAERGLWQPGRERTDAAEIAALIGRREIAVAVAGRDGRVVGCLWLHDVAEDTSEFGLFAVTPAERGTGAGRELLDFVEAQSAARGLRAVRLELLVPRDWTHPSKEFLKAWYGRRGYEIRRTAPFEASYPHVAPALVTPCDLEVREKLL